MPKQAGTSQKGHSRIRVRPVILYYRMAIDRQKQTINWNKSKADRQHLTNTNSLRRGYHRYCYYYYYYNSASYDDYYYGYNFSPHADPRQLKKNRIQSANETWTQKSRLPK